MTVDNTLENRLHSSYRDDKSPLLRANLKFPDMEDIGKTINLILEILFPNYFYKGDIENAEWLKKKKEISDNLYQGIYPYMLLEKASEYANGEDITNEVIQEVKDKFGEDIKGTVENIVGKGLDELPTIREELKKYLENLPENYVGNLNNLTLIYAEVIKTSQKFLASAINLFSEVIRKLNVPIYPAQLNNYIRERTRILPFSGNSRY